MMKPFSKPTLSDFFSLFMRHVNIAFMCFFFLMSAAKSGSSANQSLPSNKEITWQISKLGDTNYRVIKEAQKALVEAGPSAIPYLAKAVASDSNPQIRGFCVNVIAQIKDESGIPALVRAVQEEKDERVRNAALTALGEFGEAGLDQFGVLLDHPDKQVRHAVVLAIVQHAIRYSELNKLNNSALKHDESSKMLERIIDLLLKALNDSEVINRIGAVTGLDLIGTSNGKVQRALIKASSDKDIRIRLAAQQATHPEMKAKIADPFFGKRSTKAIGTVDFSQAKAFSDIKTIVESELRKYSGEGKIELIEAKDGPDASTFGYSITLPEFHPGDKKEITYNLTGMPIWDQQGLAREARFQLETFIVDPKTLDKDLEAFVPISSGTHFVKIELVDSKTGKVLAETKEYVGKLEANRVPVEIQMLYPSRVIFDVDLPDVIGNYSPALVINYDTKNLPIKRNMRVIVSANPPPE